MKVASLKGAIEVVVKLSRTKSAEPLIEMIGLPVRVNGKLEGLLMVKPVLTTVVLHPPTFPKFPKSVPSIVEGVVSPF